MEGGYVEVWRACLCGSGVGATAYAGYNGVRMC